MRCSLGLFAGPLSHIYKVCEQLEGYQGTEGVDRSRVVYSQSLYAHCFTYIAQVRKYISDDPTLSAGRKNSL